MSLEGLSAQALDAAFPYRVVVDVDGRIVRRGPALAGVEVGEPFEAALRVIEPAGGGLRERAGAEIVVELVRGGERLSGVVAEDRLAGTLHLLLRQEVDADSPRDRAAAVLLRELSQLREATVEESLLRILRADALALAIERVSFWSLEDDARGILCHALYNRSTGKVERGVELLAVDYPAYFAAMREGKVIAAEDAMRDPRTREFADGYLAPNGIGAMLDVPVFVGGELHGVLCHEHVGPPRELGAHEQQIALAVAQSLAQVFEVQARRRAEEAVRASEARFRKLIEISPVPVLVSRLDNGRILYGNQGLELLLRTTRERILAANTTDFYFDPSERGRLIATLRRDGFLKEEELRIQRPDGTTFWGMISVHPMEFDGQQALITGLVDLSEHKRAEEEVQRVLKALGERDALLTGDLERARAFQDSMHPAPPRHPALALDVLYHPAEEVSGDVYDYELEGDLLRLFVADATGHGVSAALTTMFLRSEYEVASHSERSPGAVLRALNARMTRFLGRFAMRFTAACATLDLRTGELRWATAAHPPPCLVRDGAVVELETGGSFVGLVAEAEFPEHALALRPGDLLFVYTDGLSEALDAEGKPLGERRLYDRIANAVRAGVPVAQAALEAARTWAGQLQDDATLVAARWQPPR